MKGLRPFGSPITEGGNSYAEKGLGGDSPQTKTLLAWLCQARRLGMKGLCPFGSPMTAGGNSYAEKGLGGDSPQTKTFLLGSAKQEGWG